MNRKRLLVVEDDRDILETIKDALELEGYQVFGAENGKTALEHLLSLPAEKLPGCILLDLMMPVMDGLTFAKSLARQTSSELSRIPIIVITAKGGGMQDLQKLPSIVDSLPKPIDLDDLLTTVEKYCG